MNQRQKMTSLTYLLNEVTNKKKMEMRYSKSVTSNISLSESELRSMLRSGFFTINELNAMRVLFLKTKTLGLNEVTFTSLDNTVSVISESFNTGKNLTEGFLGDIWDGLKKLGNKAKDALVGGWAKLKAIWGEFKELMEALVEVLKDGLNKMYDKGKDFATKQLNSFNNEIDTAMAPIFAKLDDIAEQKKFSVEVVNAYDTGKWVVSKLINKTVDDAKWADDVIAGNGNPEEPPLDDATAEQGIEALKQEEGILSKKQIVKERNMLFSDKAVLSKLYEFSQKRLMEGGGGSAHLEDAISNPVLKKVVKVGVKIMAWSTIPIAKLVQGIAEKKAPEFLNAISSSVKIMGGPGAFLFPMFGLILAELVEILIKSITPNSLQLTGILAGVFFPPLIPILTAAEGVVKAIKMFLLMWTIGTILFNVIVSVRKAYTEWKADKSGGTSSPEGGASPQVQTAGYKPRGKFKLKEGKLIFVS